MRRLSANIAGGKLLLGVLLFLTFFVPLATKAAGVTVITHGLNGNADGWVTGMAKGIPKYYRFPGTNFTFYKLFFTNYNNSYFLTWNRLGGSSPSVTDSGEIVVAFDWSQLADGSSFDTYQIASVVSAALTSTNFISELNGHALCESPIHLVGHSRGGSVMCEASRMLGTNGIWVDHLTTLDPHPLNATAFPLDGILYSAVDAPCTTYQNVLFHDNYWQNIAFFVYGEPVSGAYVRQLTDLSGGYNSEHSNVHLWYHGTLDFDNPATDGDQANPYITNTERSAWWSSYEYYGINAGFLYSLIGGGNRTSADRPLGLPSDPAIRDGYNQNWDLGGGTTANRTALSANGGLWPNIIKFNITGTNVVMQGNLAVTKFYYQYGGSSNVTVQIYFDRDFNPYNTNGTLVIQGGVANTGVGSVFYYSNLGLTTTNVAPGTYAIYAKISDGKRSRYLYTPELLTIVSTNQPPVLGISKLNNTQYRVAVNGVSGQTIALQTSTNLQSWLSLVTNTLNANSWIYTNTVPNNSNKQFYRARLQ